MLRLIEWLQPTEGQKQNSIIGLEFCTQMLKIKKSEQTLHPF